MKQDKVIFGEVQSIVEQTKNPRLIARRIENNNKAKKPVKVVRVNKAKQPYNKTSYEK